MIFSASGNSPTGSKAGRIDLTAEIRYKDTLNLTLNPSQLNQYPQNADN